MSDPIGVIICPSLNLVTNCRVSCEYWLSIQFYESYIPIIGYGLFDI